MDMKSKGIRWVESIYQTIETVYDDVDSAMNQAPMKLVGNPVHTVGKGVKKFYSSVMQDLLPPPSSGNDDVCKSSPEESDYIDGFIDSKNMEENEFYMNGGTVEGAASRVNQGTANTLPSSSPVEPQESNVNETNGYCNSFDSRFHAVTTQSEGVQSQENVSCNSAITESELTSSQLVEKPRSDPYLEYEHIETPSDGSDRSLTFESAKGEVKFSTDSSDDALPISTKSHSVTDLDNPANDTFSNTVGKSEQNDSIQLPYSSKPFAISSNSYDVDPLRVSESETLSCSSGSLAEQGWATSTLESSMFSDICISDDLSDSEPLEESFSVDDIKLIQPDLFTNTHTHFASSHRRPSLKSYKKLLKDTLNSKKRLAKEYKQLGIWHGDIYEEPKTTTSTKPSVQPAMQSSSTDTTATTSTLSEWELL